MRTLSFSSSSSAPTTTTSTTTTKRFLRQNRIGRKTVERRRATTTTTTREEEEEEEKNEKNIEKSYSPPSIIVVVEGINDAKRVRKALNVSHPNAVFAMRGSYFDAKANRWKIQANVVKTVERNAGWLLRRKEREEAKKEAEIVVFTDPDVAGRQYRQNFIQYLPRAKHAFVSRYRARCKKKTRWHEVNDCGVEFATDGAIRVAVKEARAPRIINSKGTPDVVEWMTMREIERRGLKGAAAAAEDEEEEKETTASSTVGVSSKRLRHVLGNVLGIGECDARQLQRQLNMFFTSEEFEVAMETALELIESGKADECDFSSSSSSSSEDEREEEEDFGFDPNAYVPPGQAPPGFD
jgi:ribonuclease M5